MKFTLIFSMILFSYLAGHFFVYFSLVKFFTIPEPFKSALLAGAFILAGSFFLATYLSHLKDNVVTRSFYFLSGSWLGLLVNLMFSFVVVWILVFAFSFVSEVSIQRQLAVVAIIFSIAFSIYGIWNAFNPKVNRIQVDINNLPEVWKGKRIVQISDVHLGHIYSAKYLDKVIGEIRKLNPDAIVITGDLFDGTDGKLDSFIEPLKKIEAPRGVYYATGNHETYLGTNKALEIISKTNIVTLRDEMKIVDGVQIIGVEYPDRMQNKDLSKTIAEIKDFDKTKPSILLWHIPTQIEQAKNVGISLMLSGHTHRGQIFPFQFVTSLIYRGYDYGLKKEGDFNIYTSSGLGGWGPPMRTENRSEIVEITLN